MIKRGKKVLYRKKVEIKLIGDLVTSADGLFQCLVLFETKEYINF